MGHRVINLVEKFTLVIPEAFDSTGNSLDLAKRDEILTG
jgi:hypothetical protein